jgi:exodeoxyribonuclease VII small subunit
LRYVWGFPQRRCISVPKSARSEQATTFEGALTELESIVTRMEGGQLSLEQSLADYKRGAELLKFCQAQLADAQQQVKILEAGALKNFAGDDDNDH